MSACADLRVLFRAAAGPRRGFGHLVRCRSLGRALGVRPLVSVRGGRLAERTAIGLGCDVARGGARRLISTLRPDVVVVDDPSTVQARRWIAAARRAGVPVVSLHDLGLGCREADLAVDGSLVRTITAARGRTLRGPRYATLDPACAAPRAARRARGARVLIALGGGPRAALARRLAHAIAAAVPGVRVRVAGGFAVGPAGAETRRITWTGPLNGLVSEFDRCDVAVVGGGVSMFEACARGVAAIGIPVVAAQRPTVMAFVTRRVARGVWSPARAERDVVSDVADLLARPLARLRMAARARALVDGRGAERIAQAIADLVARSQAAPDGRLREAV
jgi:spore coat polysaccharide biosynthesis predicted glycosyltransferase SpsG